MRFGLKGVDLSIYTPIDGDGDMALNFRVCIKQISNRSIALQLFGDFDGSSACELINVLDNSVKKSNKVAIDTDRLKTIDAFGLDVFLPRMFSLNSNRADIEVTGRFSDIFKEAWTLQGYGLNQSNWFQVWSFKLNDDYSKVNAMADNRFITKTLREAVQDTDAFRHRTGDRRKVPSKGFTYISVVGWICRREQCRRKDGKMDSSQMDFGANRRQW